MLPLFPCPFPMGGQPPPASGPLRIRGGLLEPARAPRESTHGGTGEIRGAAARAGANRAPLPPGMGSQGSPPCLHCRPDILSLLTGSLVFVGCKAQGAGIACDDTSQPPDRITRVYCPPDTTGAPLICFQAGLGALLQWEPRGGGGWPGPAQTALVVSPL